MTMANVDLTSIPFNDWTLLGAGRANAVFAYVGKRGDLKGQVLRLCKPRQKPRPPDAVALEEALWAEHADIVDADPMRRACAFVDQIARPMLGEMYVAQQIPAAVTPKLARALLALVSPEAEAEPCSATVMPNHTAFLQQRPGLSTLCVELKPKWGCMPSAATIHPDNRLKRQKSKFQLQQMLKLAEGKVAHLSHYDPLDLFSGSEGRMAAALQALIRQPQNNFRLFRDSQPCPLSGLETPDGQQQLMQATANWAAGDAVAVLVSLLQQVLLREEVLANVLKMQQLDAHDIEGVHPLYHALLQRREQQQQPQTPQAEPQAASPQRTLSPQQSRLAAQHSMQRRQQQPHSPPARQLSYDHQQQPQQQQRPDSPPSPPGQAKEALQHMCCSRRRCSASEHLRALAECQEASEALLALPQPEAYRVLRDYMMAAMAKDCSVMITLRRLPEVDAQPSADALGTLTVSSQQFEYKVAIADLDLKPLEKIDEHYELDCAIMYQAKLQRLAALLS